MMMMSKRERHKRFVSIQFICYWEGAVTLDRAGLGRGRGTHDILRGYDTTDIRLVAEVLRPF